MLTLVAAISFATLFERCAPDVSPVTLDAVVQTESGGNPNVVANVTDGTSHYFDSADAAIRFVNGLSRDGKKFSAGLMQIYSGNFSKVGVDNNTVFDPCENIKAGAKILAENFDGIKEESDEQIRLQKALSKYYSGNESRGFKKEPEYGNTSYIERVKGKAYKVPAILTEKKNQSGRSATIDTEAKKSDQQWDIFGDFSNVQ
ncbi:conjugal transfer protein [Aeromonas veronii]|uniref:lytic transglycosylase domain-containing protein n=1 Tax=Aeromonas veronii TaxID=654 RepID=UPI000946BDF9|nr:lytic transglycosylase domain-containing protein [Aeromonas veronii]OLF56781.1 conjugal transfer protein [Aeromonas veronii]